TWSASRRAAATSAPCVRCHPWPWPSAAAAATCSTTSTAIAAAGGTTSTVRLTNRMHLFAIPRNRLLQAVAQRRPRTEAERRRCARRVECAARLSVRHRFVPPDRTVEARQLGDRLRELADRDLDARADVHRLRVVVALRR